jgi:hypothetical protein
MTRIPAKLFRDYSPKGPLFTVGREGGRQRAFYGELRSLTLLPSLPPSLPLDSVHCLLSQSPAPMAHLQLRSQRRK